MEKIIEHIGIETLKRYGGQNCCLDDYLFVTDRLENILAGGKTIKMEVLLMIYCMEGRRGKVGIEQSDLSFEG